MPPRTLTTLEAANIGRQMGVRGLYIYRDDVDRRLWKVVTPGRVETHEPMDENSWSAFIASSGWIDQPVRYDAGKGRKVTVPGNDEQDLFDAVREQLSPHAIAAIASCLQTSRTNNPDVDRQVGWFQEQLCQLVGGYEQQSRLAEELGL